MSAMIKTPNHDIANASLRYASMAEEPQVLTDIYDELCNIAVWKRRLPAKFTTQVMQDIVCNPMPNKVLQVRSEHVEEDIKTIAQDKAYGHQLRLYIHDVVDMFCVLFDTQKVGLRLTVLDKAMCPRFHFDRVPCRLVSTFCGSGTEWIPNEKVNTHKLGHGSGGKPDEVSGLIQTSDDIERLECGDVALLKGDTWEGNEGAALVHRSPALNTDEPRLLLTIDFVN